MAMTKAQRTAAAKKGARTRKRNSTPTKRRKTTTPTRRRRRTPAKKGMLSELFNPKMAQAGASSMVSGAVGAIAVQTAVSLTPNMETKYQNIMIGFGAFAAATMLKKPSIAAGMTGVLIYKMYNESQAASLNDNADFADSIESLPMVLNENGESMDLQENEDMYLADGMYLEEDVGYNVGYYGQGFAG